jgi:hypothetical protein
MMEKPMRMLSRKEDAIIACQTIMTKKGRIGVAGGQAMIQRAKNLTMIFKVLILSNGNIYKISVRNASMI